MALDNVENFVEVNVAGTHTSSDTVIQLGNGEASDLPDPSNGEYNLVWFDETNYVKPGNDPEVEIVRVTGRDTGNDTITVSRGQENTSPVAHDTASVNYIMLLSNTAKIIEDVDAANFSTNSVTVAGNNVVLGSSTTVNHSDLSNIGSGDHHTKTSSLDEISDSDIRRIITDTAANLPAAGTAERLFFEVDTGRTLYDNGSAWIEVGLSESQIALGNLESNNHSELSNIATDDHHVRPVAGTLLSEDGSNNFNVQEGSIDHDSLTNFVANEHVDHSSVSVVAGTHLTGGGDLTTSRTLDVDETGIDVEDLGTSSTVSGEVPVSQGDGSLAMQEVGGGLERIADLDGLVAYKQSFRNRADWIDHIFQNNESMADEITSSQVLTHYVFESGNDAYDRFIDPNHNLGLFAYNNDSEPTLSSVYEGAMFLAPTSFLEGLMTVESVADQITSSQVLMDAVHNGDSIMENNFGFEAGA